MWHITDNTDTPVSSSVWFDRHWLTQYFPNVSFPVEIGTGFRHESDQYQLFWVDDPAPEPVPETADQARFRAKRAIEQQIQTKCAEYGFDSIITAGYRAALPESPWHSIGKALALWADECWVASNTLAEQVADEFAQGTRTTFPTDAEVIAALPGFSATP